APSSSAPIHSPLRILSPLAASDPDDGVALVHLHVHALETVFHRDHVVRVDHPGDGAVGIHADPLDHLGAGLVADRPARRIGHALLGRHRWRGRDLGAGGQGRQHRAAEGETLHPAHGGFSVGQSPRASGQSRLRPVKVPMNDRIRHPGLAARLASPEAAADHIRPGDTVAMSGFTGAGYPKAVPQALAARMEQAHAAGGAFRVKVLTGASTAPELDGALAKVDGMELRMPYQSDPEVRSRINAGQLEYIDIHLS